MEPQEFAVPEGIDLSRRNFDKLAATASRIGEEVDPFVAKLFSCVQVWGYIIVKEQFPPKLEYGARFGDTVKKIDLANLVHRARELHHNPVSGEAFRSYPVPQAQRALNLFSAAGAFYKASFEELVSAAVDFRIEVAQLGKPCLYTTTDWQTTTPAMVERL